MEASWVGAAIWDHNMMVLGMGNIQMHFDIANQIWDSSDIRLVIRRNA